MKTFSKQTYIERRKKLRERIGSGLILFLGNEESPVNYPANPYPFRQDSSFLYFFGLSKPGLAGVLDADDGTDILYGTDPTLDDVIWTGPQPSIREMGAYAGISKTGSPVQLKNTIRRAISRNRKIHFLSPYRGDTILSLQNLLEKSSGALSAKASPKLIRAVIELRSVKSVEEISEIEGALEVTHAAHATIFKVAKPHATENEILGKIMDVFSSRGMREAYPVILSVRGEILHNLSHQNTLKKNDLLLADCGAESPMGYASDVTRTCPVGGKFSPEQRDVYQLVLQTQLEAIGSVRPGKAYREIHLRAAATIASGLKDMGLMKGGVGAAVENGAHALFFPHGLGHMLGLDVHDMESLGEDHVGYDNTVSRSRQFGLGHLRLAKKLQAGNVLTVEPGVYFIPALMDLWKSENKFRSFIDYAKLEKFRDFGGIRIEDDVLVTDDGSRVLGRPIPKTVEEIETLMG